jgi:hypothetical protein
LKERDRRTSRERRGERESKRKNARVDFKN